MTSEGKLEWDLIDGVWMSYEVDPMQMVDYKLSKSAKYIKMSKIIKKYIELPKEYWRTVPGYSKYMCSTFGRVKIIKTKKLKVINVERYMKKKQYVHVSLVKDNSKKMTNWKLHRLVACTWLDNVENKPCVNHIDGDIYNNRLSNLEWSTHKENSIHAVINNLKARTGCLRRKVKQYDMNKILVKIHNGVEQAAKDTGFKRYGISKCCLGKVKSYQGFIWKYVGKIKITKEWKQIKGYKNYILSPYGDVYNSNTKRLLTPNSCGTYLTIMLYKNKKGKQHYIHRLVAETFLKKNANCDIVDHIDGNDNNNHYKNLRWTTQGGNMKNEQTVKKLSRKVKQYSLNGKYIRSFDSLLQAAASVNGDPSDIAKVARGTRISSKGFKWKYSNENNKEISKKSKKKNKSKRKNKIKDEIKQRPDNIE